MNDLISLAEHDVSVYWIMGISFVIGFFGLLLYGYLYEKKSYNNGICPVCGNKLRHFDNDSQGGRGYRCKSDKCNYIAWVSYDKVDKNYNEEVELF